MRGQCANFISLPTIISSGMCTLFKCSFYKHGKQNCSMTIFAEIVRQIYASPLLNRCSCPTLTFQNSIL